MVIPVGINITNLAKIGVDILAANLFGRRVPVNVMLSLTDRCQQRCLYCGIPFRGKSEMDTKQILNLIDQLKKAGTRRIALWGGEPLIRKDIGLIIDYIKEKGIFLTLDTNGFLVPEKIQEIRNLDILVVSLDGAKDVHDRIRGEGSFDQAMAGIRTAIKYMPVWTITVLNKYNLGQVDFILDLAEKTGFYATFQVLHHSRELAGNTSEYLPSNEEYRKCIRKLIERKKSNKRIVSSAGYLNYILGWNNFRNGHALDQKNSKLKCWAGKLYCNIDTDGSVWPCSVMIGKMGSHNALKMGFRAAFDNMPQAPCNSCNAACFVEYNYICSLHVGIAWNLLKNIKVRF